MTHRKRIARLSASRKLAAVTAVGVLIALTSCASSPSGNAGASSSACDSINLAAVNPSPVPASLDPAVTVPPAASGLKLEASQIGAQENITEHWWNEVKITAAQAKAICEKHLTAVYMDWDTVLYNQTVQNGARDVFKALGIKLLRVTNYSLNSDGLSGDLSAVLPLKPNIILTGGPIDAKQLGPIMQPAISQGAVLGVYGTGATTLKIGSGGQMPALLTWDCFLGGAELADAVHARYPNGANLGYIHYINNVPAIYLREQGFLDELKKYPNIHVIADGGPANPQGSTGFNDPNAAQAYTEAFLIKHPTVNLLFAPWENPPALGEEAAIKSLNRKIGIVTMDMGTQGASQIKAGGPITVELVEDGYDVGRTEALATALDLLGGVKLYGYYAVPTFAVSNTANLTTAWNFTHGPEFPCSKYC